MYSCNVANSCKQIDIYIYDVSHSCSHVDIHSYDVAKFCAIHQSHTQLTLSVALAVAPKIPLKLIALRWVTNI